MRQFSKIDTVDLFSGVGNIIGLFGIDRTRPVFTYTGNKQDLLPEVMEYMPDRETFTGRFYDGFTGSGAVALGLGFDRVVMNDLNSDVILAHRMIRDHAGAVMKVLKELKVEKKAYYEIRRRFNDSKHPLSDIVRAAYMIYLLKTCHHQGYRVNRRGGFNQSIGDRTQSVLMEACCAMTDVSAFLNLPDVELRNMDFEQCLVDIQPGDVAYFDPPYDNSKDGYNPESFGQEGLRRLAKKCAELTQMGVEVIVSNYDTPLVRELFPEPIYDIKIVKVTRGNRAQGDNAKNEVVIWNRVRV